MGQNEAWVQSPASIGFFTLPLRGRGRKRICADLTHWRVLILPDARGRPQSLTLPHEGGGRGGVQATARATRATIRSPHAFSSGRTGSFRVRAYWRRP